MTLVSYAQNFEDVMLWRALGHVEAGTYLDIGAQDPVVDSVSRAFYDAGWRGVHVEPVPHYAAALRADRVDERVIAAVVGDEAGLSNFHEIPDTGLSTGLDVFADRAREIGWADRIIPVPRVGLDALFDLFEGRDIHWMKIDVEGMEPDVLRSWGDHPARPWVIVVESVAPLSQVPSHQAWIDELHDRDYREVYFDGLNRFFVGGDHAELGESFVAPPNVFDGFVVADDHFSGALLRQQRQDASIAADAMWQPRLDAAEQAQGAVHEHAVSLEADLAKAHDQVEQARAELLAAQSYHATAQAELQAAQAGREAQLGDQLREAGSALLAGADGRADLHADFARRIEASGAAQAARIDRLLTTQAGRESYAARREADLSRLLNAAQDRHANAEADLRAVHLEREAQLGKLRRDADAAVQDAADQRAELHAEFARRIEADGAAHAERNDRTANAQAARESDLLRALNAAHARIAAADAQLGRAAILLHKIEGIRGWRWTAPLRILLNPRRAPALNRQIASLATELAGRAESMALATAPAATIPAAGKTMNVANLQPPDTGIPAASLGALLALRDRAFVRSAYLTVLGREADPDGEAHHLYWLRRGVLKMQVLGHLRWSPEGRAYDPGIAGLDRAIRRHRRRKMPLIGAILRGFGGGEGDSAVERGFRALTNEIGGLRDDQSMWMTQIFQMVDQRVPTTSSQASLDFAPEPEPASDTSKLPAAIEDLEVAVKVLTAADAYEPAELHRLSPRARTVYRRIAATR